MDGKTIARLGAVAFVALAIVATAIEMNRHDDPQERPAAVTQAPHERDPLDAELARCSEIGEAGPRDPVCLKAWGQARRRFLGQPTKAAPVASAPAQPDAPMTLFPSAAPPVEPDKPAVQPAPAQPSVSSDVGAR